MLALGMILWLRHTAVLPAARPDHKTAAQAAEAYSEALKCRTSSHILWANRAAALLRLNQPAQALEDARRSRTLSPAFAKVGPVAADLFHAFHAAMLAGWGCLPRRSDILQAVPSLQPHARDERICFMACGLADNVVQDSCFTRTHMPYVYSLSARLQGLAGCATTLRTLAGAVHVHICSLSCV